MKLQLSELLRKETESQGKLKREKGREGEKN